MNRHYAAKRSRYLEAHSTTSSLNMQRLKRKRGAIAVSNSEEHADSDISATSNDSTENEYAEEFEESSGGRQSDIDKPRVAQWEPEYDDDLDDSSRSSDDDEDEGSLKVGLDDLSSLPFETLLKARKVLDQARAISSTSDSETGNNNDEEGAPGAPQTSGAGLESRGDWNSTKKAERRAHKHAPVELTSKKPVTRRRQVVEVKKASYRDPRFSVLSGELTPASFQKRYSFLIDLHKSEVTTLKENLDRATKMLRSSPKDQREAREYEVQSLERALKRAESAVNQDRREHVELEALEKIKRAEKERRKEGKGEWHLKDAARKELLLRARHDALAETGGKLAVKKAIEKRQKKISQKEKKQRPDFASRPTYERGSGDRAIQRQSGDVRRNSKRSRFI